MKTALARDVLDRKKHKDVFIQVGTNDGNDLFRDMVVLHRPRITILIEPNKDLIPEIKGNYADIDGVFIENVAITTQPQDDITLYIPKRMEDDKARNGCVYTSVHFSLHPMNDWGDKEEMITIHTKGVTMASIFDAYKITHVDYLCLDTEGYDAEIINTIDFDKVQIDIIKYEDWAFPVECFTKHNDNWQELGEEGMRRLREKLISLGYEISTDTEDNNKLAVKDNI